MSASSEDHAHVDLGERLLVTGLMLMLVTEGLTATAAMVRFSFLHVLWGIVCVGVALYLANWIYTGERMARKVLLGWTGLQVLLSFAAVLAYFASRGDEHSMRIFGIAAPTGGTAIGLAVMKLASYLFLGFLISQLASVKNFLRVKAGKEPRAVEPATLTPSGVVVALSEKEKLAVAELGTWMNCTGIVLIAVGLLALIASVNAAEISMVSVIRGGLILALGAVMLGPVAVLRQLSPEQLDLAFLLNAVSQLKSLYAKQVALFGGLAVVTVVALFLLLR